VHRDLKMHLTKKFVNLAVRILNKLVPEAESTFPQTRMAEHVFQRLFKAYRIEAYCGRFDDVPYQPISALKDKNFMRLLLLTRKILLYLGENDRYYRQWLGYAFLLVTEETGKQLEALTYDDCLELCRVQWDFDLTGAFPPEYFEAHKPQFLDMVLANFLTNLA
jgi:hypothetical protein